MTNELEDWQLALLVEARRFDDPTLVEANEAELFRDYRDVIDDADALEAPVAVERSVKEQHEKAEALLDAASGIDDWEVVPAAEREAELEALSDVKELLSGALKEQHGLRDGVVESMSASAMVDQFRDEDNDSIELDALTQQPETGGSPSEEEVDEADESGTDALADVSGSDRAEAREKLEKAERLADRTPNYAESLRADAADLLGVDPDHKALSLEVL